MALFKRTKKDKDALPEEVREYYQTERRERTGKAWLLAILTLLVTFLIAAALFFGGRWVYRAIFDNDDSESTSTSQTEPGDEGQGTDTSDDGGDAANGGESGEGTGEENGDNAGSGSDGGQTSSTNTDSSSGSTAGASTTTPNTGPEAEELVNTGPGDEL